MSVESSAERLSFLSAPVDGFIPHAHDEWDINDSTFTDYFAPVELAGHPEGVLAVLEDRIGLDKKNVGIDIGGGANGIAIRGLIEYGLLGKGLVTNLLDKREESAENDPALEHIAGNILNGHTWKKIERWADQNTTDGVSLVMHRPFGGMQDFTSGFYMGAVHKVLDMIRPGGAIFTQVPGALLDGLRESRKLPQICKSLHERPDIDTIIPSKSDYKSPKYTVIIKA